MPTMTGRGSLCESLPTAGRKCHARIWGSFGFMVVTWFLFSSPDDGLERNPSEWCPLLGPNYSATLSTFQRRAVAA